MSHEDRIAKKEAENIADVLVGRGPGLKTGRHYVIAKDTKAGMVFVGGVGAMAVGRAWVRDAPYLRDETYADAPELVWAESSEMWGGRDPYREGYK